VRGKFQKEKKMDGEWGGKKNPNQKLRLKFKKGKKIGQLANHLGEHMDQKNPINAPFIHDGALVGASSLYPYLTL
jgi:hypothetical protein